MGSDNTYEPYSYDQDVGDMLKQGLLRAVHQRFKDESAIYQEVLAITGEGHTVTRDEFIAYVRSKKVAHPELEAVEQRLMAMPPLDIN